MSSHFSDDRDVLPEPTRPKATIRRRYATASGKLTILLLFAFVCVVSCAGGIFANQGDLTRYNYAFRSNDFILCRAMEAIFGLWLFAVGCSVGSFLNVVAWRGPRGMSINGHSFCPRCQVPIAAVDNIPIIGWLRLRGRCLTCRLPISAKYPIFEVIGGFIFLFLYVIEFLSHGSNLPISPALALGYGMPLNLSDLPSRIIWMFASHLILLSTLLAVFMTRNNGSRMPSRFIVFSVFAIIAILLFEPNASNVALFSIRISAALNRQELAWYFLQIAIGSMVAATLLAILERFVSQPTRMDFNNDGVRIQESFREVFWNWFLIVFLILIDVGILPALVILSVSLAIEAVYRLCDRYSDATPWGYSQAWLLGVTYMFILSWKILANITSNAIG